MGATGLRILLVEDDPAVRGILVEVLRHYGYEPAGGRRRPPGHRAVFPPAGGHRDHRRAHAGDRRAGAPRPHQEDRARDVRRHHDRVRGRGHRDPGHPQRGEQLLQETRQHPRVRLRGRRPRRPRAQPPRAPLRPPAARAGVPDRADRQRPRRDLPGHPRTHRHRRRLLLRRRVDAHRAAGGDHERHRARQPRHQPGGEAGGDARGDAPRAVRPARRRRRPGGTGRCASSTNSRPPGSPTASRTRARGSTGGRSPTSRTPTTCSPAPAAGSS